MAGEPALPRRLIRKEPWAMPASAQARVSLVVVDETEEHRLAVHYAARRAFHTGGKLALLYVIEPTEMQQWLAVEELARAERREAAEELLGQVCQEIAPVAGSMPVVYIREGRRRDELLAQISEDPTISILVLAAGIGTEGPGPLVSHLTGKAAARLRIPITIVPGGLSLEEVEALS
jgi:nucleotide-binding universal stress UspA family protein